MCYAKVKSGRIQVKEIRNDYGLKGQRRNLCKYLWTLTGLGS